MKSKVLSFSFLSLIVGLSIALPSVAKAADFNVSVLDRTPLYNSPDVNSAQSGTIAPQKVSAIKEVSVSVPPLSNNVEFDKWYQINTYLGPKWINNKFSVANNDIVSDSRKIGTFERKVIYDAPSKLSKTNGTIAPQILNQISTIDYGKRFGTSWYQINTYLGPKWIEVSNETSIYAVSDVPKPGNVIQQIHMKERTTLYGGIMKQSFYDEVKPTSTQGTLAPQTVDVIQKYGDWYQIKTYLGPMWLLYDINTMSLDTVEYRCLVEKSTEEICTTLYGS